jgi:DNA-binding CsgD family transcriptional regulator
MLETKTPSAVPQRVGVAQWKQFWNDKAFCQDIVTKGIVRKTPDLLKRIFHVGPYFFVVINYVDMNFELVKGTEQILGFTDEQMYEGKPDFLVSLLHPDDRDKVLGLAVHYYNFLDAQPPAKRMNFKVSLNLRLRQSNGQYVKVLEQVIALNADQNGRITHALKYFTSIAHLQYSNEVVLSILDDKQHGDQNFYTFDLEEKTHPSFTERSNGTLSSREKEVLALIAMGKTSKEISDHLNISAHTVNKHRENMMRKTSCKNISEVVSFAYCHDYL